MKKFSVLSALAVGLGLGVGIVSFAGCNKGGGSSGSGGVVAVVNGTSITQDEFLRYMMLKPTVSVLSNKGAVDARVAQPLGFQALNDLVKQKLVVQMAKQENVYPSDADITKEMQFRLDGDPNFVKNLTAQGLDPDMIKQALAVELCQDNLVGKGITISDADIDQYRKQNPQLFMQPATIDLQWILVKSADAKKQVDDQLRRGQPFDAVAQQFSEDPQAKERKGAFRTNLVSQIDPDILKAVKNIAPLHSTDWINGSDNSGTAKFYVVNKTDAKPIDLTDHLKEVVRRRLRQIRGSNAREIGSQLLTQEKQSKVEIKMGGLQGTWDAYIAQLTKASAPPSLESAVKGSTTGTTAGATTGK